MVERSCPLCAWYGIREARARHETADGPLGQSTADTSNGSRVVAVDLCSSYGLC